MVIAINTRIVSANIESVAFLEACFELLAEKYPAHSFIFITATKLPLKKMALQNVQTIVLKQQSANPLLWKLWYQYKLPSLLKKIKADVLVNGDGICSLRTSIPQCLLTNNFEYLQHPEWYPQKYVRFMRTNTPAFLKKANSIITHTQHFKNEIFTRYQTNPEKITVIYPGVQSLYKPISSDEKTAVKEKYTGGKEYFLFNDQINQQTNLILLLKAFSFFKKRQKSNMQLVIIPENMKSDNAIFASLSTYKYRNDVVVIQSADEATIQAVTAAAYTFITVPYHQYNFTKLLQVLQNRVPIVASNTNESIEILADAALYANPASFEDIADRMMLLFKDEDKRNDIIEKGTLVVKKYHIKIAADQLWATINTIIQPNHVV